MIAVRWKLVQYMITDHMGPLSKIVQFLDRTSSRVNVSIFYRKKHYPVSRAQQHVDDLSGKSVKLLLARHQAFTLGSSGNGTPSRTAYKTVIQSFHF